MVRESDLLKLNRQSFGFTNRQLFGFRFLDYSGLDAIEFDQFINWYKTLLPNSVDVAKVEECLKDLDHQKVQKDEVSSSQQSVGHLINAKSEIGNQRVGDHESLLPVHFGQ